MEFKTKAAEKAYLEILADVSERSIRMYEGVKRSNAPPIEQFHMNLMVEHFQVDGRVKAINTATGIDASWAGLAGGLSVLTRGT